MKILVVGDTHFKEELSYADYILDRRNTEKKEILDFIIKSAKDCQHVIFLGDFFNSKNNSSEVNRQAIEFLEKFGKENLYIISGNHCKKGDGSTALDFIREIKDKPNWHIFTKPSSMNVGDFKVDFLPYMLDSELGVENHEEATKAIMKNLDGGDILFTHHAISGTVFNGIKTDLLNEVILPRAKLSKKYKLTMAGHIHSSQATDNVITTGSIFANEVGETEKFIWKIKDDLSVEPLRLPGRGIWKLENPTLDQLIKLPKSSIIKIIVSDKKVDVEELKVVASGFDAHLLIEDYPSERKKMHIEEGAMDFSVKALLKMYAEERKIDYQKLLKGLEIISQNA